MVDRRREAVQSRHCEIEVEREVGYYSKKSKSTDADSEP